MSHAALGDGHVAEHGGGGAENSDPSSIGVPKSTRTRLKSVLVPPSVTVASKPVGVHFPAPVTTPVKPPPPAVPVSHTGAGPPPEIAQARAGRLSHRYRAPQSAAPTINPRERPSWNV